MKSITKRKTTTSTEVKQRWEAKTYKKYMIRLRQDTDKDIIDYIEQQKQNGVQISELVREGLERLREG